MFSGKGQVFSNLLENNFLDTVTEAAIVHNKLNKLSELEKGKNLLNFSKSNHFMFYLF